MQFLTGLDRSQTAFKKDMAEPGLIAADAALVVFSGDIIVLKRTVC